MIQRNMRVAKRPILVTGSIRSGTTWVGRMLAASPSVGYIHEPFNAWIEKHAGICGARFHHWLPYLTSENALAYRRPIQRMLEFQYNLMGAMGQIRSWKDIKPVWKEWTTFREHRAHQRTALVKDPLAVFSAEWLADTFDMTVIVLIRHPAAFASSMKRLDWDTPFQHLLDQPLLVRDHLQPFQSELGEYARAPHGTIDRAVLLWRMTYYVVSCYRQSHPDWIYIRHEDLSRDPLGRFRDLYARLGLEYSPQVQAVICEHSNSVNPGEVPATWPHALKRDSRSSMWTWKQRLGQAEVDRVRAQTADVASEFYAEGDW